MRRLIYFSPQSTLRYSVDMPRWDRPTRFNPLWIIAAQLTRPDAVTTMRMVVELEARYGRRDTAALIGVSTRTLMSWRRREFKASAAATRAVWSTWVFCFHPERVRTLFDWCTWGTLRPLEASQEDPAPPAAGPSQDKPTF